MPSGIHILNFAKNLASHKDFLKSLATNSLFKRKVIIQKATDKELRLLQKILTLFLRGDIGITNTVFTRLKKSKKLSFIEEEFSKIKKDPELRKKILRIISVIHLFTKATLKKK